VCLQFAGTYVILRDAEQDQDLESLERTVLSTKHIALAVNEELDLHTRLLVGYDHFADGYNYVYTYTIFKLLYYHKEEYMLILFSTTPAG
jgi:hypothetical protein